MKHISIGVIKEIQSRGNGDLTYKVSLFKGKVKESFASLEKAKLFAMKHIYAMLEEREITALCVKYKRIDGFSSFFMYDYLWSSSQIGKKKKLEVSEYEETHFEYYDSHGLYFPYWKKAKLVNERSYCAGDVLRASSAHSPRTASWLIFLAAAVFVATIAILANIFYNCTESLEDFAGVAGTLIIAQGVSVAFGLLFLVRSYMKEGVKVIKVHQKNFNEVDWKELYKKKKISTILVVSILLLSFSLTIGLTVLVEKVEWTSNKGHNEVRKLIIALISLHLVRLVSLCASRLVVYKKMAKLVSHLFDEDEIEAFKIWLKSSDPIWEFRTHINFFVIPNEISSNYINLEKEIVRQNLRDSDTGEVAMYAKRVKRHYKTAIKKHLAILGVKNDNIQ